MLTRDDEPLCSARGHRTSSCVVGPAMTSRSNVYIARSAETVELWQRVEVVAELTCEPRWAFGAGVGNGNASVLSRASMVDQPSTLKIELIYWPATTFAARAEAQSALFRYIDGWYNPRRIQAGLDGLSPDEYEAPWQTRQSQPHSATLQPEGAETR